MAKILLSLSEVTTALLFERKRDHKRKGEKKDRAGKKEGLKINDFKDDLLKKKKIEKVEVHR